MEHRTPIRGTAFVEVKQLESGCTAAKQVLYGRSHDIVADDETTAFLKKNGEGSQLTCE
jgi:hypothetical protein